MTTSQITRLLKADTDEWRKTLQLLERIRHHANREVRQDELTRNCLSESSRILSAPRLRSFRID